MVKAVAVTGRRGVGGAVPIPGIKCAGVADTEGKGLCGEDSCALTEPAIAHCIEQPRRTLHFLPAGGERFGLQRTSVRRCGLERPHPQPPWARPHPNKATPAAIRSL